MSHSQQESVILILEPKLLVYILGFITAAIIKYSGKKSNSGKQRAILAHTVLGYGPLFLGSQDCRELKQLVTFTTKSRDKINACMFLHAKLCSAFIRSRVHCLGNGNTHN